MAVSVSTLRPRDAILITPQLATAWLNKYNTHNRPLENAKVQEYADQMKQGRWRVNGESIIFSNTNRLLDGQHRLFGCIEADTAFKAFVVEGVDEDSFATIDTGKKRSAADVLHMDGIHVNAAALASTTALVIAYTAGTMASNKPISRSEVLEFVRQNPAIEEWVKLARCRGSWTAAYAAPVAATMFLASKKYSEVAKDFITKWASGEDLKSGSPILALRSRLGADKRLTKQVRMALVVSAWNAFVENRKLTKLQLPRSMAQAFPTVAGAKPAGH